MDAEAKEWLRDHGIGEMAALLAAHGMGRKPGAHARLGASSAERYMACAGSPRACDGLPDITTPYARQGSAAHLVGAACLVDGKEPIEFLDTRVDLGDGGPKILVDEEMVEGLDQYIVLCAEESGAGFDDEALIAVEHRISLEALDPEFCAEEPMFGTADFRVAVIREKRLKIIDLKYGYKFVVATNNAQTRYYAVGELLSPELINEDIEEVECIICQPRAPSAEGPIRREVISVDELMRWAVEELMPAARRTREPDAPLVAGDHCLFCRAAAHCETLKRYSYGAAMIKFSEPDLEPDLYQPTIEPSTLTVDQVSSILTMEDTAVNFFKAVKMYAFGLANTGVKIPGWKLVGKKGRRKWVADDDDDTAMQLVFQDIPEDKLYTRKLKSPAQIEATLKEMMPRKWRTKATFLGTLGLYERPAAGVTLAREDDKREEVLGVAESQFEVLDPPE